jgi:polyhydroxyalkanoate synthesis repressor PhaR
MIGCCGAGSSTQSEFIMERKAILIKKYENRRLYDTTNSRYINLEEIAEFIKEGRDVKVVDAASGRDITRVVLTQIIMDDAKGPDSAFPLDILRQMVIASGRATQESAFEYMKAMSDMYRNAYRTAPRKRETRGSEVDELKRRVEELEATISNLGSEKKARKPASGGKRRRSRQ